MFKVTLLEIDYPQKWSELTHSQILGVLTHLGIELDTFGDIINDENGKWQFFVKTELKDYFIEQVTRVGRTKVKLHDLPLSKVLAQEDDSKELSVITISLRLDAVVSAVTNLSRSQVKKIIADGEVKLNWHLVAQSNIIVSVQDMFSIRHYGRYEIINLATTKKGKKRLEIKAWQAKKR
ncbi:MAG: YlmH/Sll1252 family protein, partial [Lactobacillus gasseri]|jgi:RNA-binding protein YlmH|nr:YlmH/Sll1252 family protein [Lactobacillus gasseri]